MRQNIINWTHFSPHYTFSSHFSCGEFFHMIICHVKNLSTWQSVMWRVCPLENLSCGQISPHDRFFSTVTTPGTHDKYQVCISVIDPLLRHFTPLSPSSWLWSSLSSASSWLSILLLTFLSLSKKIFMEYVGKYKSCKKFGLSGSGAGEWYIRCNDPSEPGNWTARRIGPHLHWQHRITLTHCRVSTLLFLN